MMQFMMDKKGEKKFWKWNKKHKCKHTKNSGAIGGRLSFCFIPTGLGQITKIKCVCGEEIDLTEYEEW